MDNLIPTSVVETPIKYNWIFNTGFILSSQQIPWSPFLTGEFRTKLPAISIGDDPGAVFIEELPIDIIKTCVMLAKGEVKWISQHDSQGIKEEIDGNSELRILAFIQIHFKKYTGILNFTNYGKNIISITAHLESLCPYRSNLLWHKKLVKLYNHKV
jgi:hypothetical protein